MTEEITNINNQLPYNPSDVDIRQQRFSVDVVIQKIKYEKINLWKPIDYQRLSGQWNKGQKSRLIESLIMRIPLPIFYFDGSDFPWKIIDGLQRLTTLYQYIADDKFELSELEYIKGLEGKKFSELPFVYQRVIENSVLECYIINPGTPDPVKYNIFKRINTNGISLRPQELRNVYFSGRSIDFINSLAETDDFLKATQYKISQKNMKDKEYTLRFFAFYNSLAFYNPPMDKFLDANIAEIEKISEAQLYKTKNKFIQSMSACRAIFGKKAFYILNRNEEPISNTPNISLFETWAVNLAILDIEEINKIKTYKSLVIEKFALLLQHNIEFYKSITSGTSNKQSVFTRFYTIKKLLKEIIDAN